MHLYLPTKKINKFYRIMKILDIKEITEIGNLINFHGNRIK